MNILRKIYRHDPPWWHLWSVNNPPGAVALFFIGMAWACWIRDGRALLATYAMVFIPGAIAYFTLKLWKAPR